MKFNDRSMALLGIPDLPPRAFIRKAGGGIIPQGGGGSAPTTTAEKTTGLPAWALPYAQDTLAKQQALSNRPYQAYEAPRIAGFTPLQEQAKNTAAGMQTSGATGAGIGLAGAAGMGGLNNQTFGSAQEQSMNQQGLSQAYQDFQNQQNYPQQQLGYMANMINGLPLGSTTTGTTTYNEGSPSGLQSLGSLASTAYGLSKFFKDGGLAEEKSVTDEDNIAEFVRGLTDQELAQAKQAAEARGDQVQLEVIAKEEGLRASIQNGGLASLPVNMNKMMPTTLSAARGGIVAFAGTDEDGSYVDPDLTNPMQLAQLGTSTQGNPKVYNEAVQNMMQLYKDNAGRQFKEFTPADAAAARKASREVQMEGVTEDPYKGYEESIKKKEAGRDKRLEQAKGLAAIKFGAGLVKGNNLSRAIAGAGADAGEFYGAALKAEEDQQEAIAKMRFHMGEAKRKEQMGLSGEARKDAALAQKARLDAFNAGSNRDRASASMLKGIASITQPRKGAGGGAPKPFDVINKAELAYAQNPTTANRIVVEAARRSAAALKEMGPGALAAKETSLDDARNAKINTAIADTLEKLKYDKEFLALGNNKTAKDQMKADVEKRIRNNFAREQRQGGTPAPATGGPTLSNW